MRLNQSWIFDAEAFKDGEEEGIRPTIEGEKFDVHWGGGFRDGTDFKTGFNVDERGSTTGGGEGGLVKSTE